MFPKIMVLVVPYPDNVKTMGPVRERWGAGMELLLRHTSVVWVIVFRPEMVFVSLTKKQVVQARLTVMVVVASEVTPEFTAVMVDVRVSQKSQELRANGISVSVLTAYGPPPTFAREQGTVAVKNADPF